MANFFWLEGESSAGFSVSMRNAVDYIHGATHGRPKHVDKDVWDVAMERGTKRSRRAVFHCGKVGQIGEPDL
ncbi:unnamed protein product [Spirodela intermedia]|uniref:Uncharacterized protein n=1 Tax=Spirodela intermedia TaxID=51605 RepID=A0A7I8IA74_SPIIN|nr:unnamed protein product [Spirodela intermedia]CAA6654575.1 unnamed protein product [Spirodela intermedia]